MGRNEILTELWSNDELNTLIGKMEPAELQEDLKAEVFFVLADMEEERLVDMHDRKVLKYFIIRTLLNMIKSDRSTFYKQYRNFVEFDPKVYIYKTSESENEKDMDLYDKLEKNMADIHWYNAELLKLYAIDTKFNAKEISRKTGIPYISIIRTLHKTKNELKKRIRK